MLVGTTTGTDIGAANETGKETITIIATGAIPPGEEGTTTRTTVIMIGIIGTLTTETETVIMTTIIAENQIAIAETAAAGQNENEAGAGIGAAVAVGGGAGTGVVAGVVTTDDITDITRMTSATVVGIAATGAEAGDIAARGRHVPVAGIAKLLEISITVGAVVAIGITPMKTGTMIAAIYGVAAPIGMVRAIK